MGTATLTLERPGSLAAPFGRHTLELEAAGTFKDRWPDLEEAERTWGWLRESISYTNPDGELVTLGNGKIPVVTRYNYKHSKEMKRTTTTVFLNFTGLSGASHGTCTNSTLCEAGCIVGNSHFMHYAGVHPAREARTRLLFGDPESLIQLMRRDIEAQIRWALKKFGPDVRIRLRFNAGTDVAWELVMPRWWWDWLRSAQQRGLDIAMYDYTKRINRVGWVVPDMYRTTYSATSRTSLATILRIIDRGDTVALVLPIPYKKDTAVPTEWYGLPMVDGDTTDDRFNDPSGVLVGLLAKGPLIDEWRKTGTWGPLVTSLPQHK